MHFYWTLKSVPELRGLESSQRRVAWRACAWRALCHWQTWAAFLGAAVLMPTAGFLGLVVDGQTHLLLGGTPELNDAMRPPLKAVLLMNSSGIIGLIVSMQVLFRMTRPHLSRYVESEKTA